MTYEVFDPPIRAKLTKLLNEALKDKESYDPDIIIFVSTEDTKMMDDAISAGELGSSARSLNFFSLCGFPIFLQHKVYWDAVKTRIGRVQELTPTERVLHENNSRTVSRLMHVFGLYQDTQDTIERN